MRVALLIPNYKVNIYVFPPTVCQLEGPGGACLATLRRIGWDVAKMSTTEGVVPHKWVTHHGVVDLLDLCPKSVGDLIDEATQRWLWSCEAKHNPNLGYLEKGCFFDPLFELLHYKNKAEWGGAEKGQLGSCLANGIWPQERLFKAGLAESDKCLICGEFGSLFHRIWKCPCQNDHRFQYGNPFMHRLDEPKSSSSYKLMKRPLLPVTWSVSPPLQGSEWEDHIVWDIPAPEGVLSGDVCGDGSGLYGKRKEFMKCGWAVRQVHHD